MDRKEAEKLSREQQKQDQENRNLIRKELQKIATEVGAWWALFLKGKDHYTFADDGRRADRSARALVDGFAESNGIDTAPAATNGQLIDYATAVYANAAANKTVELIRDKLRAEAKKTAKAANHEWQDDDDNWLDKLINESFDGTTWSDRIWSDMAGLRSDLYKAMRRNLLTHTNPTSFDKELQKAFDVTHYQADRILRTEGARVSGMRMKRDLQADGYKKVEWIASADACRECLALDGDIFPLSEMNGGKYTLPAHPNCRCAIAAHEEFDDD